MGVSTLIELAFPSELDPVAWLREQCAARGAELLQVHYTPADLADLVLASTTLGWEYIGSMALEHRFEGGAAALLMERLASLPDCDARVTLGWERSTALAAEWCPTGPRTRLPPRQRALITLDPRRDWVGVAVSVEPGPAQKKWDSQTAESYAKAVGPWQESQAKELAVKLGIGALEAGRVACAGQHDLLASVAGWFGTTPSRERLVRVLDEGFQAALCRAEGRLKELAPLVDWLGEAVGFQPISRGSVRLADAKALDRPPQLRGRFHYLARCAYADPEGRRCYRRTPSKIQLGLTLGPGEARASALPNEWVTREGAVRIATVLGLRYLRYLVA